MNTGIEELYKESLQLLKQLIATPSLSREEQDTATIIHQFLQGQHIAVHRMANNVWACNEHYDAARPTILLNSHHDTVQPNAAYTRNPFAATIENDKLYGLGSNDAGGCLVALLAAFLYFYHQQDLKYNLIFAATAEEEISGSNGIAALLPHLGEIDAAIVGEPTQMHMAIAEKGLIVLDCTTSGKAGHAARDEGENAIYKALDDIQWFRNYQFPKVSDLLGPVKMSLTMINAGTQHNVVPATCTYVVDVRGNEHYTNEELVAVIKSHVSCTISPRSMRLRATNIDKDHYLVNAGSNLGRQVFGSATLSDKVFMTFPALKMGPGDSSRSHMADEYIYLHEIQEGIQLYIQLLKQVL